MTAPATTEAKKPDPMRVITPVGQLSYPHLFKARVNANAEDANAKAKYQTAILFKPGENIDPLKNAVIAAGIKEWGKEAFEEGLRNGKITLPFKSDWKDKGYPEGTTHINASSEIAPGVVGRMANPSTGRPDQITDQAKVYPGVFARLSLRAYAYNYKKNGQGPVLKRGVSLGLQNVQIMGDGPRLDNRVAAEQEFEADMQADSAAGAADLKDLIG